MAKEKEVDLSAEVEKATKSAESDKNVSQETKEIDLNQKIDKIGADLKAVVDKLDSFEVSEEEQEAIMSGANDSKEEAKSSSLGWIILGVFVLIIGAVAFGKDKILDKLKKQEATTI